ncbi:MAG: HAD-IB family hydrolase [Halioglobus sp.]
MPNLKSHLQQIACAREGAGPSIAFFDLDRTLIAGYSIVAFAMEAAKTGARYGEFRESARLLRDAMQQGKQGRGGNYHRLVNRLASALAGRSERTLEEIGERAFKQSIARNIYREAIELVEAHRAAGHQLVMVTAATRYQAEPVARVLGIEEICCTQLEVQDGRFTGKSIAPLCYGEGKTLAARRVLKKRGGTLKRSWFYSDSSDDLSLLRKVGKPVAVNPSDKLAVHARNNDWPQLHFASRGLPGIEQIARTSLVAQSLLATTAIGAVSKRLGAPANSNANRLTRILGDIGSGFAGLDFEIEGNQNLHRERPAIFVFNHQSLLDSMVMAHLLRGDVVALCKKEMANNPFVGLLLRQVDTIFVDRQQQDQGDALKQSLAVLKSGRSLVIAPEGTRSTLGDIQPFKHGAFLLARKAGVPIVPIVLHNVKDALPKGALLLRPATIRVTVLPPIAAENIRSIRQSSRELEDRYGELLGKSPAAALPFAANYVNAAS